MLVSFFWKGKYYDAFDISDTQIRDKLSNEGIVLFPIVQSELKKHLLKEEASRIKKVLSQYGYNSLADVVFYAQAQNDEEAKAILNWYSNSEGNGYDDLIWDWIENELPKYQTVEELISLDLKQIETQIFERTKSLLPQEEE